MSYQTLKALHIIFIITWFSGLFYIIRLFIYHAEALQKQEPEKSILANQFKIMQKRLWYGITWPSAILTLFFASFLLYKNPALLKQGWMHIKLLFVLALYTYHFFSHWIFQKMQKDTIIFSSNALRIYNEVASIILVAVVFLVVLKNSIDWMWAIGGLVCFGILLMLGIKLYKKVREK